MSLYGNYLGMEFVWLYDFEYGIMCILDFGRDFYGFQT